MLYEVTHIGITVSNLEQSIAFYRDMLGLMLIGTMTMEGDETDRLFQMKGCVAKIAYLNGSNLGASPPIELIEFVSEKSDIDAASLRKTSISEVCFRVENLDRVYNDLLSKGVKFLSEPQFFDFRKHGFSKSKAVYFKDPDGIILELMEYLI